MKNLLLPLLMLGVLPGLLAQDGEFHLNQEYTIKNNGVINLECSDAKVFVTGSDRSGSASVKIDRTITGSWRSESQDFKVDIETEDGNLNIAERNDGSGISFIGKEEYKIEIKAPEGMSLTVRGGDGDYYIKNINGSISMHVDDADADLTACKGNAFSFSIDDGEIRMDGGKGSLHVDADDANVRIFSGQFSSIEADMDDGDLFVETSLDDKGKYTIHAQDGSVDLDITSGGGEFDIRHEDTHVVTSGPFKLSEESEEHSKFTLKQGSAKISVRADDARIKLTARN
jgi:hypothetical protein